MGKASNLLTFLNAWYFMLIKIKNIIPASTEIDENESQITKQDSGEKRIEK